MFALILCGLVVAASVSGQQHCTGYTCDERFIQFNIDQNCVPVKEDGDCCPSSFNCTSAETQNPGQCYVKGHAYDIGTRLTGEQVGDKCVAECKCIADSEDGAKAHLQCVRIECPAHLGVPPPPGCSYTYSHDQCCNTGKTCDSDAGSTPFTCPHGNHLHRIGERFYPDDQPCFECICMEGYDGTVKEPWCKRVNCGFQESHHEGCAPIFSPGRCCPTNWQCRNDTDNLVMSSVSPPTPGALKCRYGTDQLDIGFNLDWSDSCVTCKCNTPPYFKCQWKEDCDLNKN